MILTITNLCRPATDLGYLLHKHPGRFQTFQLPWGRACVFYPEVGAERCTAALLLDIDPVALVRRSPSPRGALAQYVNDRPYVASSFMSVAIARVFGSALRGRSEERPELAQTPLPLEAKLAALPCRGGGAVLKELFEPLGYDISATSQPLDEKFAEWGESEYFSVQLRNEVRLSELLGHLYVLIPVLDDDKHYWVSEPEIDKLLRHGSSWLPQHPEREFISRRYLKHRRWLVDEALARLGEEDTGDSAQLDAANAAAETSLESAIGLRDRRVSAVVTALKEIGAQRVLDLGCGEGSLLLALLDEPSFREIVGMDVSCRALAIAKRRLRMDELAPRQRERIQLIQGSLMYRDRRLAGYDAAAVVEVMEHLDGPRLRAFERALFQFARPRGVVLTTPNAEYNAKFEGLASGNLRHRDHRFEWTRAELASWGNEVAARHGYEVTYRPVGDEDASLGAPTQMAVFVR